MKIILKAIHSNPHTGKVDQELEFTANDIHNLDEALDAFATFLRGAGFYVDTLSHVRFDEDMNERFEEYTNSGE